MAKRKQLFSFATRYENTKIFAHNIVVYFLGIPKTFL